MEEFRGKSAVLDEHCRAIGRDPAEVVRSKQLIVSADDPAAKRGQVLGFVDAGLTHVVLAGAGVTPAWLAEEIAQPILARVA